MINPDGVRLPSLNIHPTAIVHPGAKLGRRVEIGPYCLVGEYVTIADGTKLLSQVIVTGHTRIGKNCSIHPFAVIGTASQDKKYKGELSYVRIGDRTVIREYVTINRGTGEGSQTVVGDDTHLLAYVHVAHNCTIGNRVVMSNLSQLAGHVSVDDGTVFGGMVGVHQFVRIGRMAMLAGQSKILKDVPPFFMVSGDPAYARGLNNEGLKRNNVSRESVNELKEAYRQLYRSEDTRSAVIEQLRMSLRTPEGKELLAFFEESSRRGIVAARKSSGRRGADRQLEFAASSLLDEL